MKKKDVHFWYGSHKDANIELLQAWQESVSVCKENNILRQSWPVVAASKFPKSRPNRPSHSSLLWINVFPFASVVVYTCNLCNESETGRF